MDSPGNAVGVGIKVAVIAPGPIKTNIPPEVRKKINQGYAKLEDVDGYEENYGERVNQLRRTAEVRTIDAVISGVYGVLETRAKTTSTSITCGSED